MSICKLLFGDDVTGSAERPVVTFAGRDYVLERGNPETYERDRAEIEWSVRRALVYHLPGMFFTYCREIDPHDPYEISDEILAATLSDDRFPEHRDFSLENAEPHIADIEVGNLPFAEPECVGIPRTKRMFGIRVETTIPIGRYYSNFQMPLDLDKFQEKYYRLVRTDTSNEPSDEAPQDAA